MKKGAEVSSAARFLGVALAVTASFFALELFTGIATNSLSLLTDAWHMLDDVFALALALVTAWIAQRPSDVKKTYGYYRAEILAGFLNGIFLWAVVVYILFEAFHRIQQPERVESFGMLVVAVVGLVANGLAAVALSRAKGENLNVRGAFLHVTADALGSAGVIAAGLVMIFTGWYQADPLISVAICGLIFYSSSRLVRDTVNVLLEGVPSHIDVAALEERIVQIQNVRAVHDLHVWCITPSRMCCMSAHVVVGDSADRKRLMKLLIGVLRDEFGIDHTTIQFEEQGYPKAAEEH